MADFKHFRSFTVLHTKVSTKKSNKMKMKNWKKRYSTMMSSEEPRID